MSACTQRASPGVLELLAEVVHYRLVDALDVDQEVPVESCRPLVLPDWIPGVLKFAGWSRRQWHGFTGWVRRRWSTLLNLSRRLLRRPPREYVLVAEPGVCEVTGSIATAVTLSITVEEQLTTLAERVTRLEKASVQQRDALRQELMGHVATKITASQADYRAARLWGTLLLALGLGLSTVPRPSCSCPSRRTPAYKWVTRTAITSTPPGFRRDPFGGYPALEGSADSHADENGHYSDDDTAKRIDGRNVQPPVLHEVKGLLGECRERRISAEDTHDETNAEPGGRVVAVNQRSDDMRPISRHPVALIVNVLHGNKSEATAFD